MNATMYQGLATEVETICLVCSASPGENPLGLCNNHWFQYAVLKAAGRGSEFLEKFDKEGLIGKVRHRQQYRYRPVYGG